MSNQLKVFNNEEFGQVRTVTIKNEPYFVGKDITDILGYQNGSRDINRHVDNEDKGVTKMDTPGGTQNIVVINESGLYSLILSSKKPEAKKFKHWVTSEILPSIRKTGSFSATEEVQQTIDIKQRNIKVREENAKIRKAQLLYKVSKDCHIETYQKVLQSHITQMLTGQELLPLPQSDKTTYSAEEIGNMLGISANKVGKIANKNNLKTEEYGELVWDKSKYSSHQCQTFRYYISVVSELKKLLEVA